MDDPSPSASGKGWSSRENVWSIGRGPSDLKKRSMGEGERRGGIGKRGRTVEDDDRIQRLVGPSVAARGRGGGHGRRIHAHEKGGRKDRAHVDRGIR